MARDPSFSTRARGGAPSVASALVVSLATGSLATGCGGAAGGPVASLGSGGAGAAAVGDFVAKPSGGLFRVDPSAGGQASEFRIEEVVYGRLVDVYDLGPDGEPRPWFSDFLIGEHVQSDGLSWSVRQDPITQRTAFVILRENDPERSDDAFDELLREAEDSLQPVLRKGPGDAPPYSLVPRNAALGIRFSDALAAASVHGRNIGVRVGAPPAPHEARVFADQHHGVLVLEDGRPEFLPTRAIVDLTLSEVAASAQEPPAAANGVGLPASVTPHEGNVALRIPTRFDFPSGQFSRLQNASGHGLSDDSDFNGPIDTDSPTADVVRVLRSGNDADANRGFLVDQERPVVVGEQAVHIAAAREGAAGEAFRIDLRFQSTPCAVRPRPGDVVRLSVGRFGVLEEGAAPVGGEVPDLRVRALDGAAAAPSLVGPGVHLTTFAPEEGHRPECFVQFVPPAALPPADGLDPSVEMRVRFSEPMNPDSLGAFDSWVVTAHDDDLVRPDDVVAATLAASPDLRTYVWTPALPLPHEAGTPETFTLRTGEGFDAIVDLAGNPLDPGLGRVALSLRPQAPSERTGTWALRFGSRDEDGNGDYDLEGELVTSRPEIRGQFLYQLESGRIRPRPVSRFQASVDPSQQLIARMNVFPPGVQTPLSPLGSRLMNVWRYCDFTFGLLDESLLNLDVEGLYWAPRNGNVVADRYERFRIRLGHSHRFPDEYVLPGTSTVNPDSGLERGVWDEPGTNLIDDPAGAMVVVHPKEKGYLVDPADLTQAPSGTKLMPFPFNADSTPETHVTYTWRDTTLLALGAPDGLGVPPGSMENAGLIDGSEQGLFPRDQVPSLALPLLMEYSCYPSDTGVGLNSFTISLANQLLNKPFFRLFSTGGINSSGEVVVKDPDLQVKPTGGFNPSAGGAKTVGADPVVYHGAIDVVVRVSRVHTIWADARAPATWLEAVLEPSAADQPAGTDIVVAYRGASAVMGTSDECVADAHSYDPYGDPAATHPCWTNVFPTVELFGGEGWSDSPDPLSGARYLQLRISFLSNIVSRAVPDLSAVGLPYRKL